MSQLTSCKCSTTNTPVTKRSCRRRVVPTVLTRSIILTCLFLYTSTAVNCEVNPITMNLSVALDGKPSFTKIVQAFVTNNLIQELTSGGEPLTLLAPTNAAFDALPKEEAKSIEKQNTGSYVLRYHVLTRYFTYNELYALNGSKVETLAGPNIVVTGGLPGGRIQFRAQNGALSHLEQPDVVANGHLSVQGISSILVPAGVAPSAPLTDTSYPTSAPISAPSSNLSVVNPLITSPPTIDNLAPPYPPPSPPPPPPHSKTAPFPPKSPLVKYPPGQVPPSPNVNARSPPSSAGKPPNTPNTPVKWTQPSIVQPSLSPPGSGSGSSQMGVSAGSSTSTGAGIRPVPVSGFVTLIVGACIAYF